MIVFYTPDEIVRMRKVSQGLRQIAAGFDARHAAGSLPFNGDGHRALADQSAAQADEAEWQHAQLGACLAVIIR